MTTHWPAPCLVCGGPLANARQVTMCAGCHGRLLVASTAMVATTGEFTAVSDEAAASVLEGAVAGGAVQPAPTACTWCGKLADRVKKLLRGNDACICNECVALCADIMQAELGEDWR
jgi:ATP-dependent Clp protease ATP-binding subunit ClpX